jgi:hypothetical protein
MELTSFYRKGSICPTVAVPESVEPDVIYKNSNQNPRWYGITVFRLLSLFLDLGKKISDYAFLLSPFVAQPRHLLSVVLIGNCPQE